MRNIFLLWLISFSSYAFCQEDSLEIKYAKKKSHSNDEGRNCHSYEAIEQKLAGSE